MLLLDTVPFINTSVLGRKSVICAHFNYDMPPLARPRPTLSVNMQLVRPRLSVNMQLVRPRLSVNMQLVRPRLSVKMQLVRPRLSVNMQLVRPRPGYMAVRFARDNRLRANSGNIELRTNIFKMRVSSFQSCRTRDNIYTSMVDATREVS